jgi:PAS domain S-box-containing protein
VSANPFTIVPDQTAREDAAEDALRLQEEQLRFVIDAVPGLISYVDAEQRYQFTNKGYEEWFGHSRDEVRGQHLIEILGTVAYESIRPHVEQVLAGNKVSFASWLDYKGAGKRHVQVNYEPHLDEQGNVHGFLAFILDMTGRKRVEDALRESEELNRAILSSLDTHVAVLDREGKIIAVNSAWNEFARDSGVRNEDRVGAGLNYLEVCRKAVNSGDVQVQKALDGLKAVCEGSQEFFRMEYPCHSPTRQRWFLMLVTPLKRSEGGAVVTHNDITERKRAEEELRESKERFQRLVETTNAIAWEADLETWMFTYVSPQVIKLLGYESAEWYKKDFWIKHLHPEDRHFAVNLCAESSRHLTEYEFEYRMIAADGHTVWLRDLVSVVSGRNGQKSLRGYLIDITDRKQAEAALRNSEERLLNLLENIPDHVLILDRLGTIRYINHTAPGFSKEEVLGNHLSIYLQPESSALSERSLENVFRDGVTSDFEASDVNSRSYRIRYVPVKSDGEVSSVLVVGTDITEQKQIEKSRRHLAERLEFAREDERRSLARHLHDEACQDLAAAAIYLEQLGLKLSRLLPEEVSLHRDLVKVDNLIQLTHEALRRTARALHPSILEHYGLVTALRSFTQELSLLTQRSGVVFEMEVSPDFPRLHGMVETTVYRIAQEAITNAFKHAQARKISVKLSLEEDVASIVVEDDGRGIDYGAIKESHGIGFAAMHERAELIGAKIDISTKVTEGTRLALKVPLTGTRQMRDFAADSRQEEPSRCSTDAHNDSLSG